MTSARRSREAGPATCRRPVGRGGRRPRSRPRRRVAGMRALDPRLLRRTRAARPLLAIDTLLGIATALAVLAQASLLSLIVAKAFHGAPLRGLGTEFGLLVIAFAVRAGCAWGM